MDEASMSTNEKLRSIDISPLINDSPNELYHLSAVHIRTIPSRLSFQSSQQNYRGFLNLCVALLFAHGLRLIIESWKNQTLRKDIFSFRDIPLESIYFGLVSVSFFILHLIISVAIEKTAFSYRIPRSIYNSCVFFNVSVIFLHTTYLVWNNIRHYWIGGCVLVGAVCLTMKLLSYHLVNDSLLLLYNHKNEEQKLAPEIESIYQNCAYPDNLTLRNVFYFWIAPTLCYQPAYPKNDTIRKSFVLKRFLEFASAAIVGQFLLHQFMLPDIQQSVMHLLDGDGSLVVMVDNILKIAATSLYCWLLMFFGFFHAFLNLMAELLMFGDREFYQDWWNASSLEEYWRLWNSPVHKWFKRHIYVPLRFKYGLSSRHAQFLVFGISAFMHEYLVAVPTHILKFWSFWAIFLQFPLIMFVNAILKRYPNSSFGNYFFWFVLCIIGQPMCFVLYFKATMERKSPNDIVFGFY